MRWSRVLGVTIVCGAVPLRPAGAAVTDEFHGVRSAGMGGAHRAVGTSNDTLYLNPAGMALAKRYAAELHYGYTTQDDLTNWNVSIVDSKTSPVAAGVGYTYMRGDAGGLNARVHRIYLGLAYAIKNRVAFGISGRHIRGAFTEIGKREHPVLYTGDAGILAAFTNQFQGALTVNNIVKTDMQKLTPLTAALGLAFAPGAFLVTGDCALDLSDTDHVRPSYHLGGEYVAGGEFPLRAGYEHLPYSRSDGRVANEDRLSLGAAWIAQGGAFEGSASRSLQRARSFELIAAVKFFL